jgi:hypothetical protein
MKFFFLWKVFLLKQKRGIGATLYDMIHFSVIVGVDRFQTTATVKRWLIRWDKHSAPHVLHEY